MLGQGRLGRLDMLSLVFKLTQSHYLHLCGLRNMKIQHVI